MKNARVGIAAALLLAAAPVMAQVHIDYDTTYQRSGIKTYAWLEQADTTLLTVNPLMHTRVVSGIESQLNARGLKKVTENPDVYVTYHTSSKEELSVNTTSFGYGYPSSMYWDPYWGGAYGGSSSTSVTSYTRGTLVLDILDAKTKKLVWRASGTDTVSDNPETTAKRIDKLLKKMSDRWRKMVEEEKRAAEKAAKKAKP